MFGLRVNGNFRFEEAQSQEGCVTDAGFDGTGRNAQPAFFENKCWGAHHGYQSKTGRAFLKSATGHAVKNCWWLAHPLLPANGLSVALQ